MPKKQVDWFLINENYNANLFPFGFHFLADYHGFKKQFGRGSCYQSVGTTNGFLRQAYGLANYNSLAKYFFNNFVSNTKLAPKVYNKVKDILNNWHAFNKSLTKDNLSILSDKQLVNKFEQYYKYFFDMSTWSVPFSYTEYGTPRWTNLLTDYLNSLKIPNKYSSSEIFQILVSSKNKTYTAREKENILKLAIEVKQSKKLSNIFKQTPRQILKSLNQEKNDFYKKIKSHTKKYNWINFNYEGPLLDEEYFATSIKDWALHKNPKKELGQINKFRKNINSEQRRLIEKLKIDKKHQRLFKIVKDFGFQKAYRKDIEYFSYFAYEFLLTELGKRIGITVKQGHYLNIDEVTDILKRRKEVDINLLNQRIKRNFYVIVNGKAKILIGKEAELFDKQIKAKSVPKNLKELKGQCASKGRAKGRAKIIKNKTDYAKFKAGDILISWATNPNMVPLMKKASAVITDEGGVTCHAAIVSRELGIPCVIGIGFATKILKDDDQVEVDATNGIIKKIK